MNQVTDRDGSAPWMLISDIILRCLVSKLHIQSKNLKCVKWWVIHTSFKQQTEFHSSCSDNFFPSFAVSLGVHGVCWLTGLEKVKSVELQLLPEPTQAQTLSSRTLFSKLALSRKAFMLWLHAAIPLPLSHLACFSFSIHSQEKLSAFRSKVWLWNKTYVNLKWVDFLCKNTQSIIWVSSCKVASSCAGPIENRTAMWSTDGAAYGWVKVWNDSKKNVKKKHIPFVQNLLFNKQNKRSVNPHLKRKKKKKKILITHLCDSFLGPRAVIVQVFFFFTVICCYIIWNLSFQFGVVVRVVDQKLHQKSCFLSCIEQVNLTAGVFPSPWMTSWITNGKNRSSSARECRYRHEGNVVVSMHRPPTQSESPGTTRTSRRDLRCDGTFHHHQKLKCWRDERR